MERSPSAVESVKNLQADGKQVLEGILGQKLQESQQVLIMVLSPGKEPDEQARQQAHAGLEAIFKNTEQRAREQPKQVAKSRMRFSWPPVETHFPWEMNCSFFIRIG
jgi:hypothetical protein